MQEIIWSKYQHCLWPVYHGDDRLFTCSQEPETSVTVFVCDAIFQSTGEATLQADISCLTALA